MKYFHRSDLANLGGKPPQQRGEDHLVGKSSAGHKVEVFSLPKNGCRIHLAQRIYGNHPAKNLQQSFILHKMKTCIHAVFIDPYHPDNFHEFWSRRMLIKFARVALGGNCNLLQGWGRPQIFALWFQWVTPCPRCLLTYAAYYALTRCYQNLGYISMSASDRHDKMCRSHRYLG